MNSYSSKNHFLLLVFGILILIISIVGISFAIYTFYSEERNINQINTEMVKIDFFEDNNSISLSNAYPVSDKKGISSNENRTTFKVKSNIKSKSLIIGFDLGLIDLKSEGSLGEDYIKVALLDEKGSVLIGNEDEEGSLISGVSIGSLREKRGDYNLIKNYSLTSDKLTFNNNSKKYTLIAYISSDYNISDKNENSSVKDNFSFKVNLIASQQ